MAEISGMLPLEISQTDVQNLNFFWTKKTTKYQKTTVIKSRKNQTRNCKNRSNRDEIHENRGSC